MPDVASTLAAMPSSYISGDPAADEIKRRRKIAEALVAQGSETTPVQHWTQGLARVANALAGTLEMNRLDQADRKREASVSAELGKLVDMNSGPAVAPSPVAAAPPDTDASPTGTSQPRGYRNNNPLNIEAGPFAASQQGYLGSDGRFARFASLDQGVGAADKLLNTYDKKYGLNSVAGIINRWAPPGENNSSAYAATVSRQLGVDPNAPLSTDQRRPLIDAMAQYENGRPMPQSQTALAAPAGGAPGQAAPPTVPAATPPGTAQPTRAVPAIPPEVALTIKRLVANPNTRAYGFQLYQQYAKPTSPTTDILEYEYAQKQGFTGSLDQWMQRKRAGAGEYGMQPIYGVDKDGNPIVLQLGKSGVATQAQLPAGARISKEPIKFDAGTHFVLMDPVTRQPIGVVNKNIEGKEAAEERGKAAGQAQVTLPAVLAKAEQTLAAIDAMISHPGRETATGLSRIFDPRNYFAATDAANFKARLEQLQGKTFLEAYESLKGGGAITEIEGKKAQEAIARLQTSQSDEEFLAALKELRGIVVAGMDRARQKANVSSPAAAPAARSSQDLADPLGIR